MLLEGIAETWWRGVKDNIKILNEVIAAFRDAFSRKLPTHMVYRKMFSREQQDNKSCELFVCRIRDLFAQLPYPRSARKLI